MYVPRRREDSRIEKSWLTLSEVAEYDTPLQETTLSIPSARNRMSSRGKPSMRGTGLSRWALVLRCFLLFAAWQGPMPWFHCHGTLADSPGEMSAWLVEHLRSHHPSATPFSPTSFGWHVHVDLPGSSSEGSDQPSPREQERLPVSNAVDCLSASLAPTTAGMSTPLASRLDLLQGGASLAAGAQTRLPAHFLDAFAPSLPLPLRLCVLRA